MARRRKQRNRGRRGRNPSGASSNAITATLAPVDPEPPAQRKPVKLRAKIRLRAVACDAVPNIPTARVDLGQRQPVFQPALVIENKPDWEDKARAVIQPSRKRRILTNALRLATVTTLVAGVAMLPNRTPAPSAEVARLAAPNTLLVELDRLLRAPSIKEKLALTWLPDAVAPRMKRYFERESLSPPWLNEISLAEMPSHCESIAGEESAWRVTVWPHETFPVSVTVHGSLKHPRFDWPSLMGMGAQRLDQFFLERTGEVVELCVKVNAVDDSVGPWDLSRDEYQRVRLSDLEGVVRGIAYVPLSKAAWIQKHFQKATDGRPVRVTLKARYVAGRRAHRRIPVITEWVSGDWRTKPNVGSAG